MENCQQLKMKEIFDPELSFFWILILLKKEIVIYWQNSKSLEKALWSPLVVF